MSIANTWRWLPDWSEPVNERLEWRTDVQQGYDGTEERYALRAIPRRVWSWSMVLEGYERQKFEAEFYAAATQNWLVPLWWDVGAASLAAGATSYARAESPATRELPADVYLVIADRNGAQGVGPCSYTDLGSVIVHAWTGGLTRAYPAGRAYSARMAQVRLDGIAHITAGVTRYRLTAESVSDFAVASVTVEQWPLRPDRAEPLSSTWDFLRERVDYGGAWQYDVRRTKPLRGVEFGYVYASRSETYLLRQALASLAGQYGQAIVPSFQSDLTPTQPLGGVLMAVRPFGWTAASPNRVRIILRNGTTYNRTVVGTSIVGADEVLVLSPAIGTVIQVQDVRQVCWAWPARLASDAIEIVWTTPEVSQISLPWREVTA